MTRIFALLVYLICCVNVMAQNNDVFPDTMRLKVDNGKEVKIPLTYSDDNCKCYSTYEKFVEHDTTFLYREYSYIRDDSDWHDASSRVRFRLHYLQIRSIQANCSLRS